MWYCQSRWGLATCEHLCYHVSEHMFGRRLSLPPLQSGGRHGTHPHRRHRPGHPRRRRRRPLAPDSAQSAPEKAGGAPTTARAGQSGDPSWAPHPTPGAGVLGLLRTPLPRAPLVVGVGAEPRRRRFLYTSLTALPARDATMRSGESGSRGPEPLARRQRRAARQETARYDAGHQR